MLVWLACILNPPQAKIICGGDIMLDRGVAKAMSKHEPGWVFEGIRRVISRADLAFANLECPLTARPVQGRQRIEFRAEPRWAGVLAEVGFDLLSAANNHAFDAGREGWVDTASNLSAVGMRPVGFEETVFVETKGVRIAWIGMCDIVAPGSPEQTWTKLKLQDEIRRARAKADVVILSFHGGVEYSHSWSGGQAEWVAVAARAGVDLVIGHHPHVLQPVERIEGSPRRTLVAWSLGNLVFDGVRPRERRSALLEVTVSRAGITGYRLIPLKFDGVRPNLTESPAG